MTLLWVTSVKIKTAVTSGWTTYSFSNLARYLKSYLTCVWNAGPDHDPYNFVNSQMTTTWEEQQKMDALCTVYHRAIQILLENVEQIWSDLETFKSNLNNITVMLTSCVCMRLTELFMQLHTGKEIYGQSHSFIHARAYCPPSTTNTHELSTFPKPITIIVFLPYTAIACTNVW